MIGAKGLNKTPKSFVQNVLQTLLTCEVGTLLSHAASINNPSLILDGKFNKILSSDS